VTAKLKTMGELFMGRRPEREIIVPCVRWRLRNKLSLRDGVEKMAERGLFLFWRTSGRCDRSVYV